MAEWPDAVRTFAGAVRILHYDRVRAAILAALSLGLTECRIIHSGKPYQLLEMSGLDKSNPNIERFVRIETTGNLIATKIDPISGINESLFVLVKNDVGWIKEQIAGIQFSEDQTKRIERFGAIWSKLDQLSDEAAANLLREIVAIAPHFENLDDCLLRAFEV